MLLISRNSFRVPDDYADTFRVMAEEGVLENKNLEDLVAMAKFRNRLVHLYWEVNNDQLHSILTSRLSDFNLVLTAISKYLKWNDLNIDENE